MTNCYNCEKLEISYKKYTYYDCPQKKAFKGFLKEGKVCELYIEKINNNPITNRLLHLPELKKICEYWGVNITGLQKNKCKSYSVSRLFFIRFLFEKYYKKNILTHADMTKIVCNYFQKDRVTITNLLLKCKADYSFRSFKHQKAYDAIFVDM